MSNPDEFAAARAAYAAYGEVVRWKNFRGDPMPQFAELPEAIQLAWRASCVATVQHWIDNDFRAALDDSERIVEHGLAMLKVGHDQGDNAIEVMRRALASFVVGVGDPGAIPPS